MASAEPVPAVPINHCRNFAQTRQPPRPSAGRRRVAGTLAAWLAAAPVFAASPDAVVTFNEVHYNPPVTQEAEWIELHNQMAVNVDLSGWSLAGGVDFTFPPGTVIAGGGFMVVAKNPGNAALAGVPNVLGPYTGNLSNGGETVDLLSPTGRLMDRLEYLDGGRWPVAADGAGATLAKRRPGLTAADPANWRASLQSTGTPGGVNFAHPDQPVIHALVDAASTWRYYDAQAAPPAGWESPGFDASGWAEGQAPFGSPASEPSLTVTTGLVARYRAGAITGVADGAQFSPWPDGATGDGVAQDGVAVSDPRFEAGATASGEPAVSFDGNDAFATSLVPGISPHSGFVFFVVCKGGEGMTSGQVNDGSGAYLWDRDATVDPPLTSLKVVSGRYGFQKRYDDGSGLGGPVSTTAISTTQFQVVAIRRNPALGRFELWVDGTLEANSPDSGASLTPQPIVIGRHATESNGGFIGEIAELLVYQDALSDAEFQAVGAYLEAHYGLDTAFPDGTPRTELAADASTACFRTSFTFTGDPARTTLELDHTLADGAVFHLNGQELARANMPDGAVTHATAALADVPQPQATGFLAVPAGALAAGTNVLAASVHTGATDDTAWFSARLRAVETPPDPEQPPALQLNEIAAAAADPFFIELRNPTAAASPTDGFTLEVIGLQPASAELPAASVPAGGVLALTEEQLGFRPAAGDRVVLRAPGGAVADAQVAGAAVCGRCDDWPDRWLFPAVGTPGGANQFTLTHDVVIHEICYHPPEVTPASDSKQWLELHNRGPATADIGGWRLDSGVEFTFPTGTVIPPGGFLVVAEAPGSFPTPPGTTTLGPWSGALAKSGECLLLLDAAGNPADEVAYLDGGRWPGAADGAGSTLELRDPRADNALPEAWAASDEAARRGWQACSYRATASPSSVGPDGQWHEFVFGLLDKGDVLVDDLTVIEDPDGAATHLVANGDFSAGTTGWRFLGNHRHAQVVPDPDNAGNMVLLLSATGPTEHMHNHVETTLAGGRQVSNGQTYQISFRARWLGGSNRLNTRLYFNRAARTTELARSDTPGTPGAPNSTAVANAGPGFHAFSHAPAVPAPGQPVTVTTRAADPDGIATLILRYAVDGGAFSSLPMTPAADGATFSAAIPGLPAATVVRFHAAATDAAAAPATAFFPAAGPAGHAFYQVDDGLAAANGLHNLRIVMDPADEALLYQENNLMSNDRLGCTVVYDEREAYYDAGVRLKGSERGRPAPARLGFNLGFNADQLFRGVHRTVAIDRSDGQETGCQEILYDHMMYASRGVPAEYNDLCQVIAPNPAHTSHAILQLARFGELFLDSQFDQGGEGTVYEYELIYYPITTDANGFKLPQPDWVVGTDLTDLGTDKENYRWPFLIKNNEDVDDYSRMIAMARHFATSGGVFADGLDAVIDVDQWLRALAYSCCSGAGDSFFANGNHNGQFYARPDGRVLYFPHDMDYSYAVTRGIFENTELQRLTQDPARMRAYLGHLHDICTTVFNESYMAAWAAHYGALLPGEPFPSHLSYIDARSDYILGSINSTIAPLAFAITTNGGADFQTSATPVTLAGQGWVNVRAIRLAGSPVPLETTWTGTASWRVAVPLAAGPNTITLEALDFSGAVVGSDSITVTCTGAIELPEPATLVLSEIYYNPPGDDETTEFVELLNTSAATLDLSGVSFTEGITFTFPAGSQLAPGARILVVKDVAAFTAAFGPGLPVAGSYPNSLDNSGEPLALRRADGTVLHSFAYLDDPPWPVEADGAGYSLVLAAPWSAPDHGNPLSWRASTVAGGGSPGTADSLAYAEWQAANGGHGDDEDRDGDGFTTRQEYFLGGDPTLAEAGLRPTLALEPDDTCLLAVTRGAAADAASPTPQTSTDLTAWSPDPSAVFLGSERLPGTPARDRLSFLITPPPATPRFFVRFAFGSP